MNPPERRAYFERVSKTGYGDKDGVHLEKSPKTE